jgi:mannosyltransferase
LRWPADERVRRGLALLALAALVALSLYERSRALYASYWIDEGISIGIAKHSLAEIPGVLRKDGSPPLYYMLLHVWIELFGGTRELVTHWFSLACAALTIPAAYWAASAWGRAAALAAAVLAAFTPYLDSHATETRMYALVALLAVLACGAFVRGFAQRRRAFVVVFALLMAALLYTHNWAFFLGLGAAVAVIVLTALRRDRGLLRDGVLAAAGALVLYAPWIPTLLHQAEHTGAPWSAEPPLRALWDEVPHALLGRDLVIALAVGAAVLGAVLVLRRGPRVEREALLALALVLLVTVVVAFVAVQIERGWASRYFAVFLAPLVVLLGLGVARARWLGAAALVAVALLSYNPVTPSPYFKTNAEAVANEVNPKLRPGDVVLSTQAETVPLLRHYLIGGVEFADPMRRVADPRVMDWTDVTDRLRVARQPQSIEPLLSGLRPGQRIVMVRPIVRGLFGWRAPWTRLVRIRSDEIERALARDRRLRSLGTYDGSTPTRSRRVGVTATLYERR